MVLQSPTGLRLVAQLRVQVSVHKLNLLFLLLSQLIHLLLERLHQLVLSLYRTLGAVHQGQGLLDVCLHLLQLSDLISDVAHISVILCLVGLIALLNELKLALKAIELGSETGICRLQISGQGVLESLREFFLLGFICVLS